MEKPQASHAGLAFVLCGRAGAGPVWLWFHFLFSGRALGLLPPGQTALWLHGALQEKEQRPGARGQRARSFVVDVRFQLSVRRVHCERPDRDGPRAAATSQRSEHGYDVVARGDDSRRRVLANASGAARLVAGIFESTEVAAADRGDPD